MSEYTPRHMAAAPPEPRADLTPRRFEWLTPQVRAWLYGICLAVIALLGAYGIISDAQVPLWITLASAILGTATALVHTPKAS